MSCRSWGALGASTLFVSIGAAWAASGASGGLGLPVATTLEDFFQPGTQPGGLVDAIVPSLDCAACHAGYDPAVEPYAHWNASLMGQAARDPMFYACLAVANQDAAFAGELCMRCHTPGAWLAGRSTPPDGSGLDPALGDLDGVTCNVCHRLVDTNYVPGESPIEDQSVLEGLLSTSFVPEDPHNGQYVVDPLDRRRGPFELTPGFNYHPWIQSAFHQDARLCKTCHDVSNPVYSRQADGTYALNDLDTPAVSHDRVDLFPIERTYSEWERSVFAIAAIDMGGRFGGAKTEISICQDCHMPDVAGRACAPFLPLGQERPDVPAHEMNGVNSWVLGAIQSQHPETGLTQQDVDDALARNIDMQQRAADLHAFLLGGELVVRVVNQTGHKLPTGYGEGRRMWVEVRFLDAQGQLVAQHGAYDDATATLTEDDTTVFSVRQGLDAEVAALAGLSAGESFHFVLNNTIVADNRIPPRGFRNVPFERVGAGVVGEVYADQQYWHDTHFALPAGAASAVVSLWHQTTSREYVEFLRDENHTNSAGQTAYDLWVQFGKSAPILKATTTFAFAAAPCPPAIPYGLGNENSLGERAVLSASGTASSSSNDLAVHVEGGLPGARGALFASDEMASQSFAGGWRLIGAGRTANLSRTTFQFDAQGEAVVPLTLDATQVGAPRFFQVVYNDPGAGRPGLSDALRVDVCP